MGSKKRNLIGKRFGSLVVIGQAQKENDLHFCSIVRCDCGREFSIRDTLLINTKVISCRSCAKKTHGKTNTRLFNIWQSMKGRCNNPNNKNYKTTGSVGIKVCKEWDESFDSFYEWSIHNGYNDDLWLCRENMNGDFEPDNCSWKLQKYSKRNTHNTTYLNFENEKKPIGEIAENVGIDSYLIRQRIKRDRWSVDEAIYRTPNSAFRKNKRARKTTIVNLKTGEEKEFYSASMASRYLGLYPTTLLSKSYRIGNIFKQGDYLIQVFDQSGDET